MAAAAQLFCVAARRAQVAALREGFLSIVPAGLLAVVSWRELELRVCGAPRLDVAVLRRHTRVLGAPRDAPIMLWFWSFLASLEPLVRERR